MLNNQFAERVPKINKLAETEVPILINDLDPQLIVECGCTYATILNWVKRFRVHGEDIGIKVGGRWFIYQSRLKEFLTGVGEEKYQKQSKQLK